MNKRKKSKSKKIAPEPTRIIISVNVATTTDEGLLEQIKEVTKRHRHNEAGINQIEKSLRELAYADIQKATKQELVIPAFILCSCFIEQISTYRYGCINIGSGEFLDFVKEYLPGYDGERLRLDLRNRLVHNYSLGEKYILINKNPHAHLEKLLSANEPIEKTVINLENLVDELGKALDTFCQQLRTDEQVRGNALHALGEIYIIGKSNLELNHSKGTYYSFPDDESKTI